MAKKKYKRKPESWFCIQYTGSNQAELVAEYAPYVTYHSGETSGPNNEPVPPRLMLDNTYVIEPNFWVMEDNLGTVTMKDPASFNAFFEL